MYPSQPLSSQHCPSPSTGVLVPWAYLNTLTRLPGLHQGSLWWCICCHRCRSERQYFLKDLFILMCLDILSACLSVPHPHRPEKGIVSLGAGVNDGCALPRGCWELNPSLRKEQPMLLTAGLSFQPIDTLFNKNLGVDSGLVVVSFQILLAKKEWTSQETAYEVLSASVEHTCQAGLCGTRYELARESCRHCCVPSPQRGPCGC